MTDLRKAAEMALKFMDWFTSDDHSLRTGLKAPEIAEALRKALAQPEQEPALGLTAQKNGVVARLYLNPTSPLGEPDLRVELPYSEIPACNREWVGLTDEEIKEYEWMGKDVIAVIKEVQATLKEKNT